ncbi:HXXEE domain-containing protein [Actinomadura vinacea]|uniref:HXXEE domain-containing protein n=1 Tax=Actinomadura vinacea TaxID=115336 RepID=UPI003CD0B75F
MNGSEREGVGAGHRTRGSSPAYQAVLLGFGLHGVAHLAQAAAVRGYTPGSVTSPLVVIPFTLWARGRLRRAGMLRPTRPHEAVQSLALAGVALGVTHAVAHRLVSAQRTRRHLAASLPVQACPWEGPLRRWRRT